MNTGQRPDIQPFCKSIECPGRKPIDTVINDELKIEKLCESSVELPA